MLSAVNVSYENLTGINLFWVVAALRRFRVGENQAEEWMVSGFDFNRQDQIPSLLVEKGAFFSQA